MTGFLAANNDFSRIFFTDYELFDQFIGNKLFAWGYNGTGQLGDNTVAPRSSPVTTSGGGSNWIKISTSVHSTLGGNTYSAGVKSDGTLWVWGTNVNGVLGDNTGVAKSSPVTTAGGGTNWKDVSIGNAAFQVVGGTTTYYCTTAGLKSDGTLWTWGSNNYGQLGDNTGVAKSSPVTTAGGGTNWIALANDGTTCAAIKSDGTLWTWGSNQVGQLGSFGATSASISSPASVPSAGKPWVKVATGSSGWVSGISANNNYTTFAAIQSDGSLWTWGANIAGMLGQNGPTATSISSPVTVVGSISSASWKSVAVGMFSMAGIKTDGTLWTWGSNFTGTLGQNTPIASSTSSPNTVAGGGTTWKQVDVGGPSGGISGSFANNSSIMAAVKTDGTLWMWGNDNFGQIGDGTTANSRSSPTQIPSNINWIKVSAGGDYTLAIGQ